MQKVLGQDIKDPEERKQFLLDNADRVEQIDYHKSFDSDELSQKKTDFANKSIRIAALEEDIKDFKDKVGLELKPLREETKQLLDDIKAKGRMVNEKCYLFLDEEERMVGYYNAEGILVQSRPATREELQKTVFAEIRHAANE
ncbi:MAG: hypothetical protein IJ588_06265 [Prevotella sp.]|nr:hypothetical protein [Prevotella sp.]